MGSRVFILLVLLFAFILLISSEVSARDLAAVTSTDDKKVDTTQKAHEIDGRGGNNRGHGGYKGGREGGGYRGNSGSYPQYGATPPPPYGGYATPPAPYGGCYYGCCRYGYRGCIRCCSYDSEPMDAEP